MMGSASAGAGPTFITLDEARATLNLAVKVRQFVLAKTDGYLFVLYGDEPTPSCDAIQLIGDDRDVVGAVDLNNLLVRLINNARQK